MEHPAKFFLDIWIPTEAERDVEILLDFLAGATIAAIARGYRRRASDVESAIRRCVLAHGYAAEIPEPKRQRPKKRSR